MSLDVVPSLDVVRSWDVMRSWDGAPCLDGVRHRDGDRIDNELACDFACNHGADAVDNQTDVRSQLGEPTSSVQRHEKQIPIMRGSVMSAATLEKTDISGQAATISRGKIEQPAWHDDQVELFGPGVSDRPPVGAVDRLDGALDSPAHRPRPRRTVRPGRGLGPPRHHLDRTRRLRRRGRSAARSCRIPAGATHSASIAPAWRLTNRGIAVILVSGAILAAAAITVVTATAVTVTSSDYRPPQSSVVGR